MLEHRAIFFARGITWVGSVTCPQVRERGRRSHQADAMLCHAKVLMDLGALSEDADGSWRREQP